MSASSKINKTSNGKGLLNSKQSFKYGATKMEVGTKVWIKNDLSKVANPSSQLLWLPGEVSSKTILEDGSSQITAIPEGAPSKPSKFVVPSGQDDTTDLKLRNADVESVGDNLINLPYLNEPELLASLQSRFERYLIYTYTGPILIAINPYETLKERPLGGSELFESFIQSIKDHRNSTDVASSDSVSKHSILISGESGSGKTECAKKIIQVLVGSTGTEITSPSKQTKENYIVNKVLLASTVFKAFGNASTLHSLNSSRFGQYINIAFNDDKEVIYANVKTYLLENVRVVHQLPGERNFHIFYQIFNGASSEERNEWKLSEDLTFRYIIPQAAVGKPAGGGGRRPTAVVVESKASIASPLLNDGAEYKVLKNHLQAIGFSAEDCQLIFQLIAGILHLGEIQFQPRNQLNGEGSEILGDSTVDGESHLEIAARLCRFASPEDLKNVLLEKTITLQVKNLNGTHSELVTLQNSISQAMHVRDALAKAMYLKLFDYLTEEINNYFSPPSAHSKTSSSSSSASVFSSIGILDVFGFDSFDENSFEQLCINYANESLQQQFNQQMFKFQLEEYSSEQILYESIAFVDNQDCMELIGNGIFRTLDDQCRLPNPSDNRFVNQLYKDYASHHRFIASATQRANYSFTVDHYAGKVEYQSEGFIQKNTDELPIAAVALMKNSASKLLNSPSASERAAQNQADSNGKEESQAAGSGNPRSQLQRSQTSRNAPSAVAQFKSGLAALIQHVSCTLPHYIRCINPIDRADLSGAATTSANSRAPLAGNGANKSKSTFNQHHVAAQLRYGGILEAIRVGRSGYPVRYTHIEFLQRYFVLFPSSIIQGKDATIQSIRAAMKKQRAAKSPLTDVMKEACQSFLQLLLVHPSSALHRLLNEKRLAFKQENIQIGVTKIFMQTHENEVVETLRSQIIQSSIRVLCRFLWLFYLQRKEIIRKRQERALFQKQTVKSVIIQKHIRRFLAQKRFREITAAKFLKSISQDEELACDSIDHESLASFNSEIFSVSGDLPPHIAAMGKKARKARAHKQLGNKINEYKALDDQLLQEITKLLEMKRKFDEWTILRFDINLAKRLLAEWSSKFPTQSSVLRNKTAELAKSVDFGYQLLLPEKLIPMNIIGKAFSLGRTVSTDNRTNSAKTANKAITQDHKVFKNVYKLLDSLKEIIDLLTEERNQLQDRQTLIKENKQRSAGGDASDSSAMHSEIAKIVDSLSIVLQVLEMCKILYQYYLQYIAHTVREFGEQSAYKLNFYTDEVLYILSFAAILEAKQPFLSAEKNDELLKKKLLVDEQFLRAISMKSLHESYFVPLPAEFSTGPSLANGPSAGENGRPLSYSVGRDGTGIGKRVVCKLITASPGLEYVSNCLIQLLAGEILMYPIKLIKLIGKSTRNYGQVAYYQAALHFSEDTLRSAVHDHASMAAVDAASYSIVFIASLVAGISRSRPENYMTRETLLPNGEKKIEIVGINNDDDLSRQMFAPRENLQSGSYNSLNLLPHFHQPVSAKVREALLSNGANVEEIITSLLREIYLQNKRYESLLSSGFTTRDLLTLNVPIELSKLCGIRLYKKMNVLWAAMKENPHITHYEMFVLLYPSLQEMYSATVIQKKVMSASVRSNDLWYDFYPQTSNSASTSFYLGGGNKSVSRSFYLNQSADAAASGIADLNLDDVAPILQQSHGGVMVSINSERSTIEEISTEFIKCIDFEYLLSKNNAEKNLELYAAGNISDNVSFLSTLWLRNASEEQLIIMFGGLIENYYRSLHPTTGNPSLSSNGSVLNGAAGKAAVVSSKLFLKSVVIVGAAANLRKLLRSTDVVQCLEGILNVRVAFGEQDISHYHIYTNEEIDEDDEDVLLLEEEPVYNEYDERLAFFDDLEDKAKAKNDAATVKLLQQLRQAMQRFIVSYPKELKAKRTPQEVESDIDLAVDVVQLSFEDKSAFKDTIPSLQLLEFCTLLFKYYDLLYPIALPLAKRGIFNYHNHILQYLLIQPQLDIWERFIVEIVNQQPMLVFMKNNVDSYLPCDRLKQMTATTPKAAEASKGKGSKQPHFVQYRLLTALFNTTYHLFNIQPVLLNEDFYQHMDGYLANLFAGRSGAPLTIVHKQLSLAGSVDWNDLEVVTDKILSIYTGDEELIFYAIRYGFFATVEELQQKKYNYSKVIYVNLTESSSDNKSAAAGKASAGPAGKGKETQYNLIQCCLYLSKRTDLSQKIQQENRKVMELIIRSLAERTANKDISKEQLYDWIYTNGQGKLIISNKQNNNEFIKELSGFLN